MAHLEAVRQDDKEFLKQHQAFEKEIEGYADHMIDFAQGFRFQGQFNDPWMLERSSTVSASDAKLSQ